MITQAINFHQQATQSYELQAIVDFTSEEPIWFEVLYRPSGTDQAEYFFNQLSTKEKVAFDIKLFSLLPAMQNKHSTKSLSTNISPFSLSDKEFLNMFEQMMKVGAFDCSRVCIEVVETDELRPLSQHAIKILRTFKNNGGLIALDDFGGGYTHWELLHLKLADIIKVATQKFPDKQSNAIFSASATFAKNLGLQSVIEGIETTEEMEFAKKSGFNYCQGWLFNSWRQKA